MLTLLRTSPSVNEVPKPAEDWSSFVAADYAFDLFPCGSRVLDIGFGRGMQMRALAARGCQTLGIEYDPALAGAGARDGLAVCRASCEQLPFADASLDGVVCKVVILLTDEAKSVAEVARVLRPGGTARISYHGVGYSLRYLLIDPNWRRKIYALRTMANTAVYRLTGRRLPGFLGDTLFQTSRRLQRYYRRCGLELIEDHPSPRFAGAPVFIYHTVRKGY
jgi:SAM-dependent methyltransferase